MARVKKKVAGAALAMMMALALSLTGMASTAFAEEIPKNGDGSGSETVQGTLAGAWISKHLDVPAGADTTKLLGEEYQFVATLTDVADHSGAVSTDTYKDVRTLSTTAQFSSLTPGEVNKVLSGNITGSVTNSYPHAGEYIYEVVEVKPSDQAPSGTDTEGMAYSQQKYQMRVWVKNVNASGNPAGTVVYAVTVFELTDAISNPDADNDDAKVSADNVLEDAAPKVANGFTFRNDYTVPVTLKTANVITGDWADFTLKFPFDVSFTLPKAAEGAFDVEYIVAPNTYVFDEDGTLWSDGSGGTEVTSGWSKIPFAAGATEGSIPSTPIGHNETIYFRNLPLGTTYKVSETDSLTQYTKASDISGVTGNPGAASVSVYEVSTGSDVTYKDEFVAADSDNTVTITNERTNISITGVVLDNMPLILIGLAACIGIGFYFVSRARRQAEED